MTCTAKAKTHVMPGEVYPAHLVGMYDYIEKHLREYGFPPSVRELTGLDETHAETYRNGFASSTSVTRYYLGKMQDFGMIEVTPRIARGIKIIPRKDWKEHATATPKSAKDQAS